MIPKLNSSWAGNVRDIPHFQNLENFFPEIYPPYINTLASSPQHSPGGWGGVNTHRYTCMSICEDTQESTHTHTRETTQHNTYTYTHIQQLQQHNDNKNK